MIWINKAGAVMVMVLLAPLFCWGVAEEDRKPLSVCAATDGIPRGKRMMLRGTGGFARNGDGFVVYSGSCGVQDKDFDSKPKTSRERSILLKVDPKTMAQADYFSAFAEANEVRATSLFQLVVSGTLDCRAAQIADDGIHGNGFGTWGRIPCQLVIERFHAFRELR